MAMIKRDPRPGLRKAIFAAAKRAGLDDDTRHALQLRVTGKASLSAMSVRDMMDLLDHLNGKSARKKSVPRRSAPPAPGAVQSKVRALWLDLHAIGEIDDASEAALAAYVERMTKGAKGQGGVGIASLRFLDGELGDRVVKGLRGWLRRVAFRDERLESDVHGEFSHLSAANIAKLKVLLTITHRTRLLRGIAEPMDPALAKSAKGKDLDRHIASGGRLLRELMAHRGIPAPLSKWLKEQGDG